MAVDIVIDTNRYRDFVDGEVGTVAILRSAPRIYIPLVVVAELRAGFAFGSRGAENQRVFERFIHRPRVEVLMPAMETTRHYAALYRQLRTSGTPIPSNDLWIAALVIQHDVPLYSRDAHFALIPQLPRIEREE